MQTLHSSCRHRLQDLQSRSLCTLVEKVLATVSDFVYLSLSFCGRTIDQRVKDEFAVFLDQIVDITLMFSN